MKKLLWIVTVLALLFPGVAWTQTGVVLTEGSNVTEDTSPAGAEKLYFYDATGETHHYASLDEMVLSVLGLSWDGSNLTVLGPVLTPATETPAWAFKDSDMPGSAKECAWTGGEYLSGAEGVENAKNYLSALSGGSQIIGFEYNGEDDENQAHRDIDIDDGFNLRYNGTTYEAASLTFSNKTISASNNVIKGYSYIALTHPSTFGSGVTQQTTVTARTYGQALFANDTDEATNYIEYFLTVPPDLDASVDLTATFSFILSDADTADHEYKISMIPVGASEGMATAVSDAVTFDYTADASGASGDAEQVTATLTDWKTTLDGEQGNVWIIRVARDGDAANDASTVDSVSGPLVIRYGFTQ